jgi:hypothetical protein
VLIVQWLILGAGVAAVGLISGKSKAGQNPIENRQPGGSVNTLRYFRPKEFNGWFDQMNPTLLIKIDEFRAQWGGPVRVSPAAGGQGRNLGADDTSQHNVDRWGQVNAIDVFPMVPTGAGGYGYMKTQPDRDRAQRVARSVGFTGIGLYTDTRPGNMLHLDVRAGARVATWSRVNGSYQSIERVLV